MSLLFAIFHRNISAADPSASALSSTVGTSELSGIRFITQRHARALIEDGMTSCADVDGSYAGCAPSTADCPSTSVCPPPLRICDDGISCANSSSLCPNVVSVTCSSSQFRCHDNTCVDDPADCPTRISCGSGMVLCSDGSCKTSALLCPSQIRCQDAGEFRCFDGTCVADYNNCPTLATCQLGNVMCENGKCAASASACTHAAASSASNRSESS